MVLCPVILNLKWMDTHLNTNANTHLHCEKPTKPKLSTWLQNHTWLWGFNAQMCKSNAEFPTQSSALWRWPYDNNKPPYCHGNSCTIAKATAAECHNKQKTFHAFSVSLFHLVNANFRFFPLCVCMRVCVCMHVCVYICVCVCVCVRDLVFLQSLSRCFVFSFSVMHM